MIEFSKGFLQDVKKLSRKYRSIKSDIQHLLKVLEKSPHSGVSLGDNLYKIRVANSSIPTGKSGGFRVIIYQQIKDQIVLISIYSKTQKDTLSDEELKNVLQVYMENR